MTDLARRVTAEAVGTAFLVAAVIGSGIAATRLSPGQVGVALAAAGRRVPPGNPGGRSWRRRRASRGRCRHDRAAGCGPANRDHVGDHAAQLLENALITGAALVALILALQPVSAAFNPVVTLVDHGVGALSTAETYALVGAQLGGGILGAVVANQMFSLPAVSIATTERAGGGRWLGEVVATVGLILVVFGTARSGRSDRVAYAVGAYITAAYWFTSSTSFANPAVTVARMFSDTFAGIAPTSAPAYIAAQLIGGALGLVLIRFLYPMLATPAASPNRTVTEGDL